MNDISPLGLFAMRSIFVLIACVILLGNLLPLQTLPRGWSGPDLLLCFALVWSIRRPEFVPIPVLAGVFLLSDFLLGRPPGLASALMLAACGSVQFSARSLRDAGFAAEWTRILVLVIGIAIAERLILLFLLVPVPALSLQAFQAGLTVLIYPLIVLLSAAFFGVRMAAPGDLDALGARK